jgi:hypothetical protein
MDICKGDEDPLLVGPMVELGGNSSLGLDHRATVFCRQGHTDLGYTERLSAC